MADAFLGEIRIFSGNFAPMGWMFCNGQLLPIAQNTALFSILGVNFGGDGKTTFALPNMQGSASMHQGAGIGLSSRNVGDAVGEETVTLNVSQLPLHTHTAMAIDATGDSTDPTNRFWGEAQGQGRPPRKAPYYDVNANTPLNPQALSISGGNQSHNNMQPYLSMNFIICMNGIYPSRG